MKWYIGQPVVAIQTSEYVTKGLEYTILGLRSCQCNCGGVEIDVGLKSTAHETECVYCKIYEHTGIGGILFEHESMFAPLDTDIS